MNLIYFQWQGELGTNAFICLVADKPINACAAWKIPAMGWQRAGARTCARHTLAGALVIRLICYFMVCRVVTECGGESKVLIHSVALC